MMEMDFVQHLPLTVISVLLILVTFSYARDVISSLVSLKLVAIVILGISLMFFVADLESILMNSVQHLDKLVDTFWYLFGSWGNRVFDFVKSNFK
jgi:uncharacterized membrane protein (DUF106 family)